MVIIATLTLHKIQDLEQLISDIRNYFLCEATGTLRECDKPAVELYRRGISLVSFILVGLSPVVSLIYVLNIRELKKKMSKYFPKSAQLLLRRRNGSPVVAQNSNSSSKVPTPALSTKIVPSVNNF